MDPKVNALITDFMQFCEGFDYQPKEALDILSAQEWQADEHVVMSSCSFPVYVD